MRNTQNSSLSIKFPSSLLYIILAVILIGGVGVRLYKLTSPVADWHSWRQADTASVSYLYVKDGINVAYPRYFDISHVQTGYFNPQGWRFVEFPFFNIAHATAYKSIGRLNFDTWGRLISVIAASITTLALFLLGKKLISPWGGLWAAFAYAFMPYNIYFTRVILPEPLGVTFTVLGLLFGVFYFDKERRIYLLLSALMFAAALLMKPFFGFYALPLVYLALKKYGIKKILTKKFLLLCFDIALIPFFVWRAWLNLNNNLVGIPHFSWAFNGDAIRFRPAFWNWIFAERISKMMLGMWAVVPVSIGLLESAKRYKVVFLSAVGMFLYVSTVATANVRHDYYQTMLVPAIALCLAVGCDWLWNQSVFHKLASKGLMLFCLGMMILVGWYQVRDFYQINHGKIITAGEAVQRLTPEDALVVAPYNGDTAFLYQTKRFGWPVVDRDITELIHFGAKYYVSVNYDTDTNNFLKRFETVEKTPEYVILDLTKPL